MAIYICMNCKKETDSSLMKRKMSCKYCAHKILGKKRTIVSKLKAR